MRSMIDSAAIVGLVTLVALAVFFWKRNGAGSGRAFGNRLAAHLGIPRQLFHSLLDHGAKGPSRELLHRLELTAPDLDHASIELGPTLARGIERLEAHFGPQETVDAVKPIVAKLVEAPARKA